MSRIKSKANDRRHKNINDGIGVEQWILINEIAAGKWPLRAPTKNRRDEANIAPFNDPNVEQATNNGITHANIPSILFANVTFIGKNIYVLD